MFDFYDQVVVVTGAAGALGKAVAKHFDDRGAFVVHVDYNAEIIDGAFPNKDVKNLYLAVDLTSRKECETLGRKILEHYGRVDVLANVAGGFAMGEAVHETSEDTWDFLFNLNAKSILNTSAAIVPTMIGGGGGKIINVAAGAANKGVAKMGAYVASKSSVLRLTESMAMELREKNINVNAILPGTIDTPRNRDDMSNADFSKWVVPSELAKVMGFLASDQASAVHGAGIPVVGLS